MTKERILERLRGEAAAGRPIIGAGCGTGLSARCAEAGGADLLVVYNSGRYRMAGRPSCAGMMPFGDANAIVVEMAAEVLPVVRDTPVLAGVCGTDPFRSMPRFLAELRELGFSGVQNFPTVCLYDGVFRRGVEESGLGFEREVEMVAEANRIGLLTATYVITPEETRAMVEAGADVVVPHMNTTLAGMAGVSTALSLDECVEQIQLLHDEAKALNPDVIVLCHGGPIVAPGDMDHILRNTTGVLGFFGASSMERLPTEQSITQTLSDFKRVPLGVGVPAAIRSGDR